MCAIFFAAASGPERGCMGCARPFVDTRAAFAATRSIPREGVGYRAAGTACIFKELQEVFHMLLTEVVERGMSILRHQ